MALRNLFASHAFGVSLDALWCNQLSARYSQMPVQADRSLLSFP